MSKLFLTLVLFLYSAIIMAQNMAHLKQENGLDNSLKVLQSGDENILIGIPGPENSAFQYSQNAGINEINVEQINTNSGFNSIFLFQSASENNIADFTQQSGSNTIILNETSVAGSNETHITQHNGAGSVNLERIALLNNIVPSAANAKMSNPSGYTGIYQEGENNFIYGAMEGYHADLGTIALPARDLPARQISETGSNWLEIWQTGGNNTVALYQEAIGDNTALIRQFNGFNIAVIYQQGGGFNCVRVEQSGSAEAHIYQKGGGNNNAVIDQ